MEFKAAVYKGLYKIVRSCESGGQIKKIINPLNTPVFFMDYDASNIQSTKLQNIHLPFPKMVLAVKIKKYFTPDNYNVLIVNKLPDKEVPPAIFEKFLLTTKEEETIVLYLHCVGSSALDYERPVGLVWFHPNSLKVVIEMVDERDAQDHYFRESLKHLPYLLVELISNLNDLNSRLLEDKSEQLPYYKKKNKVEIPIPPKAYHVITLKPGERAPKGSQKLTRLTGYTQAPHWRRGHLRHYKSGKVVEVNAYAVHKEWGLAPKPDYIVKQE